MTARAAKSTVTVPRPRRCCSAVRIARSSLPQHIEGTCKCRTSAAADGLLAAASHEASLQHAGCSGGLLEMIMGWERDMGNLVIATI